MTRRRWIADEVSENHAALVGEHAHHLVRVLRARIGQEFDIATPDSVRRGRITSINSDRVEFDLGEDLRETTSSAAAQISLLLAIFKFDRMEWAIEKATELGVATIAPVIAQRTEEFIATQLSGAGCGRGHRQSQHNHQNRSQSPRFLHHGLFL